MQMSNEEAADSAPIPQSVDMLSFNSFKTSQQSKNLQISSKMPLFWTLGSIYGATAVAMGAFGAHGLKKKIADPARLANWNTAAHYQVSLMLLSLLPEKC